jgi:hypothetical protein
MWRWLLGTWAFRRWQRRRDRTRQYYGGAGGLVGLLLAAWTAYRWHAQRRRFERQADA